MMTKQRFDELALRQENALLKLKVEALEQQVLELELELEELNETE